MPYGVTVQPVQCNDGVRQKSPQKNVAQMHIDACMAASRSEQSDQGTPNLNAATVNSWVLLKNLQAEYFHETFVTFASPGLRSSSAASMS